MSLATIYSRARAGINAPLVTVETHLSNGLPSLTIVGLPEAAVKESKDRVRSALINSNFEFPTRRITINLAPADLPKEGGRFDLPIAMGILAASGQIPEHVLHEYEFLGELALSGEIKAVQGILPASIAASERHRKVIVPLSNANEAALATNSQVIAPTHLLELCAHLNQTQLIEPHILQVNETTSASEHKDFADVIGQSLAKRAIEIAAAGKHNLLMVGPPGTGKTMLASRLPSILPALTQPEKLEAIAIASIANQSFCIHSKQPTFRNPHHTASSVALIGGGSNPKPGEISLAHNGVLFLDELAEFDRKVLEVLREPLEAGQIVISRAQHQVTYPANFQFITAMNPCPCGYHGDAKTLCTCSPDQVRRYRQKISGPLLDRIDIQIAVSRLPIKELVTNKQSNETSSHIKPRVEKARKLQQKRQGKTNSALSSREMENHCALGNQEQDEITAIMDKLNLSGRAYHRILKVSRTIADLSGSKHIERPHMMEAIGYRRLDKLFS